MSNLPVVQEHDLSQQDMNKVDKFFEAGAPGFNLGDQTKIVQLADLYLSNKTYSQIARIHRIPKELVMAYSYRLKWYAMKMDYLRELEEQIKSRVLDAKITSQDFLLELTQMYQKKIGRKMDLYFQTNIEAHADEINHKEIDKYLKLVEALYKLSSEPTQGKQAPSPVGLNVGEGVTIKKTVDGIEITPKQKSIEAMLAELADQRRAAEDGKNVKSSDIKDVTNSQGEKNENK